MAEAVDAVNRDVRSINSAGPLSSYVKTWEGFHCKIFGDSVDIVPLTHEKIFKIGAVFKARGDRSFNNYVEAVKGNSFERFRVDSNVGSVSEERSKSSH